MRWCSRKPASETLRSHIRLSLDQMEPQPPNILPKIAQVAMISFRWLVFCRISPPSLLPTTGFYMRLRMLQEAQGSP